MSDKINIIVERGGEFHRFKFIDNLDCKNCSLLGRGYKSDGALDACDICLALGDGCFEKVVAK